MHTINTYPCMHNYCIHTTYLMAKSTAFLKILQSPFMLCSLSSPIILKFSELDIHFYFVYFCLFANNNNKKKGNMTSLKTSPLPFCLLHPSPNGAPCISSSLGSAGTSYLGPRGCGEAVSTMDRSRSRPCPPCPRPLCTACCPLPIVPACWPPPTVHCPLPSPTDR